jgi:hypothetical protein
MQKRGLIIVGLTVIQIAMLMIGGSDTLDDVLANFHGDSFFIFLGLCLVGLSAGLVSIPVLPEMLESIEQDEELASQYELDDMENLISGLFVSFQSAGEALGPSVASILSD